MPRVAVLAPMEERFGRGSGAVAHWILSTSTLPGFEVQILGIRAHGQVGAASVVEPLLYRAFLLLEAFAKKCRLPLLSRISRRALRDDRLWVLSALPYLVKSDLVHVHNRPAYARLLRRWGHKQPVILHMHNDLLNYLPPSEEARSKTLEACSSFVFCSQYLADVAHAELGDWIKRRSSVIANGAAEADRILLERPATPHRLLVAGRVIKEKGVLEAVEICRRARDLGPYELIVAGPLETDPEGKPSSYSAEVLESLLGCLDEEGNEFAHYVGELSRDRLRTLMAESFALLMPVQWAEPFGMVAVEAMSCGLPVIAAPRGGLPEVLAHGQAGILAETSTDYISAISKLAVSSNWQEVSRTGGQHFAAHFRWQVIQEDLTRLWDQSLRHRSTEDLMTP